MILEVICCSLLPRAESVRLVQGHAAGFISKMGLEFLLITMPNWLSKKSTNAEKYGDKQSQKEGII